MAFANHEFVQLTDLIHKTAPILTINAPVLAATFEDIKFLALADCTIAVDFPHLPANIPQVQNLAIPDT